MKRVALYTALLAVSLGLLLAGTAVAQGEKVTHKDQQFVSKAARDGMAEVRLGQMATQQAASPAVQQFAQRMVSDHAKANQELMAITQGKQNLTVPTEMDTKHQETAESLAKLHGADFDRAYMRHMVTDHEKAVQLFSKEAEEGHDADLKAFAAKTLPVLRDHLQMAQNLAQQQGLSQVR
jgi:putative membrane protein